MEFVFHHVNILLDVPATHLRKSGHLIGPCEIWMTFSYLNFQIIAVINGWDSFMNMPLNERHSTLLMMSQHWFR